MKTLRRNTIRFFSVAVVLLLGLLSGCEAQSQKKENTSPEPTEAQQALLDKLGPLTGEPHSLEPLTKEECFGETYNKEEVRKLLEYIYPRDDFPISGFGVLLGADERSVASKNKEFRMVFRRRDDAELTIGNAVFYYLKDLLNTIGFEPIEFLVTDDDLGRIKSMFDFPVLIVESAGRNLEEIESFEPYYKPYVHNLGKGYMNDLADLAVEMRAEMETWYVDNHARNEKFTGHAVKSRTPMTTVNNIDGFLPNLTKQTVVLPTLKYVIFNYSNVNVSDKSKAIHFDIINTILPSLFGAQRRYKDPNNIRTMLVEKSKLAVYSFDKSLLVAMYDRIKPINMSKEKFIDSVMKVMSPCMS